MTVVAEQAGQLATVIPLRPEIWPGETELTQRTEAEQLEATACWWTEGQPVPALVFQTCAALIRDRNFTADQAYQAWLDYAAAVRKREALLTLERHWSELYDIDALPPGESLQEAAIQLACEDADACALWLRTGKAI